MKPFDTSFFKVKRSCYKNPGNKLRNRPALPLIEYSKMKLLHGILLFVTLFVSGCDTPHVMHYRVAEVYPKSADSKRMVFLLQSVAEQSGLTERTTASNTTNTLFYAQDDYEWGVTILDVRFYGDDVFLDLSGGFGTPSAYRKAKRLLPSTLSTEFGSRFSVSERRVQSQ